MSRVIEAKNKSAGDPEAASIALTDAEMKGAGGVIFTAGQDTTHATLTTFVLAMVLNPDVQAEAQKQIDAVTGGNRLPDFSDWEKIPALERLTHESLRFHPAAPNGE